MTLDRTVRITVNDRINALGAYLKTKAFGWALIRTACLIGPGHFLKIQKNKSNKKCQASTFSTKITNFYLKNPSFLLVQISAQF